MKGDNEIGAVQAKVFLTTVSLGVYSLTGLCCAVLADQPKYKIFGRSGIVISIAGAAFAVLTNWEIVTGWELLLVITLLPVVVFAAFTLLSVFGVVVSLGTIATLILHWATRDTRKDSQTKT